MLGNVWEWTEDCYHDSYRGAPRGRVGLGDKGCPSRVDRGGSWDIEPQNVRSADPRQGSRPSTASTPWGFELPGRLPLERLLLYPLHRMSEDRDHGRRGGPALEKAYQFVLWVVPALDKFPRSQRFLLGDRIETTTLAVLEGLIEATCSRVLTRGFIPDTCGMWMDDCARFTHDREAFEDCRSRIESASWAGKRRHLV